MTVGQRIAQKRKELGLSQEALGDRLGVSRQSIYKWESDSALPEVEKLITLAKLFGVSVGWLLGVEEDAAPEAAPSGELTEAQLRMVEEIVSRYIAAQPKPDPQRGKRFFRRGIVVFAVLFCACFFAVFSLFVRLDRMDQQYNSLQNSVHNVQSSVNSQIGGISSRVEEILKAQNNLTAEYGTEIVHTTRTNTILFSVCAVPKTYVNGMSVEFSVENGTGGSSVVQGTPGFNQNYSGELSCQLTDSIDLSVVFIYPDGTRQTQLLEHYDSLYSESLPGVDLETHHLMYMETPDGSAVLKDIYFSTRTTYGKYPGNYGDSITPPEVKDIRVGLFKNKRLLSWAEPCEKPDSFHGFEDRTFYRLPDMTVTLTASDQLEVAALVTDTYGRQFVVQDIPYVLDEDAQNLTWPDNFDTDTDPAHWHFN